VEVVLLELSLEVVRAEVVAKEVVEEALVTRLNRRCSVPFVSFRELRGAPLLTIFCSSAKHRTTVATKTIKTGVVVMNGRYCFLLPGHVASGDTNWWSLRNSENMVLATSSEVE